MDPEDAKALFRRTYGAARLNLGGIGEEIALERPGEAGNPINWIVGHVLAYRGRLLELLAAEAAVDEAMLAPTTETGPSGGARSGPCPSGAFARV